jgi:hypothetical protein
LEFYNLYNFNYCEDGWIFIIKEKSLYLSDSHWCIAEYNIQSFEVASKLMKRIRRRVWNQLRYEKSYLIQHKAYEDQCDRVLSLIPANPLFLHTSLKICNRMKKQRLTLSEANRASVKQPILTVADLMNLILYEIGWLTTPQFTDFYWKITLLKKKNEIKSGNILENESATLITLEPNNLNTKH